MMSMMMMRMMKMKMMMKKMMATKMMTMMTMKMMMRGIGIGIGRETRSIDASCLLETTPR